MLIQLIVRESVCKHLEIDLDLYPIYEKYIEALIKSIYYQYLYILALGVAIT